ncbi:MAG TPA: TolC family protein [Candidatus Saccharimonadales bacterium]|nr:TolC family protein [Candidatus Saccharimonadales bacterium]
MKPVVILSLFAASGLVLAGCRGIPAPGEKQARRDLGTVASQYHPGNTPASLPELTPESSLSNFVEYALLNSPTVEAAFYDWSASVENITVTRSLPDPQLTFQSYIQNTLTSLMPGFMQQFPGPGKLKARAGVAVAESQAKYFAFESAALQTAFNLERAYYQLGLLSEQIRLKCETISLLQNQERVLRAQNVAGTSTLSDLLSVQSKLDRARTEFANLQDSRHSFLENFKAALGLASEQPDPPMPSRFETSDENVDTDELLRMAFERNPQLKAVEADVRAAEAGIAVAYKERVPDFNAGLSAEVYRPPFYWPQVGMTLPIWRDKVAAEIAEAKANELAAQSRLKAAQIDLVVNFAEKSFACRETSRNLALIENELIPKADQSLEITQAGYRAGSMDFSSLTDAELILVDLQTEAAETRTDREIVFADLSLLVAGLPPANAPFLDTH